MLILSSLMWLNGLKIMDTKKAMVHFGIVIQLLFLQMEELIATIARGLVDDKEAVSVTADPADEEGNVVYHLHVGAEDMGRVIGKQGRIAKAIRTIVRAGTNKSGGRATVEID